MSAFLSPDWYRVESLHIRKRPGINVVRQVHRGLPWYIIQDPVSGRGHRLTLQGYFIFGLADGSRSVGTLWRLACAEFPERPPSQSEIVTLVGQLHQADLIIADRMPDLSDLVRRQKKHRRQLLVAMLKNPLAPRLPLFDPGPFLNATAWVGRTLFSVPGFILWAGLMVIALGVVVIRWEELVGNMSDRLFTLTGLLPLVLAYIPIKILHELGHGYALRRWGVESREVGVMFLVFFPVPYVEASQSMMLPSKWQRISVSAAGIQMELGLAALATLVWAVAEPGTLRATAFNIMLIGGVSTLLFNGNPLLRFDGYFVFADLLEIPNLGQRANRYFWYLCERYILGVEDAEPPLTVRSERGWLFFYAVAAFLYRVVLLILISIFVAARLLALGVLLAVWSVVMAFGVPTFKGLSFMVRNPRLAGQRLRAWTRATAALAALVMVAALLPLPNTTVAAGYLRAAPELQLRAGTDGFVAAVMVRNGETVAQGDPLIRLDMPDLERRILLGEATLLDLALRRDTRPVEDRSARNMLNLQITYAERRLADLEQRRADSLLRAPVSGVLMLPRSADLIGRFVSQGQVLGYLQTPDWPVVVVAVPQRRATLVTDATLDVALRFDGAPRDMAAQIMRVAPEVTNRLPSSALTDVAGAFGLAADPRDPESRISLEPTVLLELALEEPPAGMLVRERVLVRFTHPPEPLAAQVMRGARQVFLSVFD